MSAELSGSRGVGRGRARVTILAIAMLSAACSGPASAAPSLDPSDAAPTLGPTVAHGDPARTGYLDRGSSLRQEAFAAAIDDIVLGPHADGTLHALSMRQFGVDDASSAADLDLAALDQRVE